VRTPAFPVSPQKQTVVYRVAAGIARPLVRLVFRSRVSGLEHVPETGFVVASNQLSNLDGVALGCALYPRQVRWMGKAELFQPLAAPFLRGLGVFPVRRGEGDIGAVERRSLWLGKETPSGSSRKGRAARRVSARNMQPGRTRERPELRSVQACRSSPRPSPAPSG
jgi:1-acyl-sn-glycerol-3-phosphate acyltransferase